MARVKAGFKVAAIKKSRGAKSRGTGKDILKLILADHKPLKQMIKIMKSESAELAEKKATFGKFAPALLAHAKPEEQTWYMNMKELHHMSVEGTEGDVEHGLASQLCEELKLTTDHDLFMAKVKVLAEMVERHIKEEEEKLFPVYRKVSQEVERATLGEQYLNLQAGYRVPEFRPVKRAA